MKHQEEEIKEVLTECSDCGYLFKPTELLKDLDGHLICELCAEFIGM